MSILQKIMTMAEDIILQTFPGIVKIARGTRLARMWNEKVLSSTQPADWYYIEGKERIVGADLRTRLHGSVDFLNYFIALAYKGTPKVNKLGNAALQQSGRELPAEPGADLVVSERFGHSRSLRFEEEFALPALVGFHVDLSMDGKTFYSQLSRRRRRGIARIEKIGYSYETREDPDSLLFYYRRMYVPHALARYRKRVHLVPYSWLRRLLRAGSLIFLIKDGTPIAGLLYYVRDKQMRALTMGVLDGNSTFVKEGCCEALFYFLIQHGRRQLYDSLDLGGCRPFLNDGVFSFKREWGTTAYHMEGVTALLPSTFNSGTRAFLASNPFVFREGDRVTAFVYLDNDHSIPSTELKRVFARYNVRGFDGVLLATRGQFSDLLDQDLGRSFRIMPDAASKAPCLTHIARLAQEDARISLNFLRLGSPSHAETARP